MTKKLKKPFLDGVECQRTGDGTFNYYKYYPKPVDNDVFLAFLEGYETAELDDKDSEVTAEQHFNAWVEVGDKLKY